MDVSMSTVKYVFVAIGSFGYAKAFGGLRVLSKACKIESEPKCAIRR